jgi:hypothetical protein
MRTVLIVDLVFMELEAELRAMGFTTWWEHVTGPADHGVDALLDLNIGGDQKRFAIVAKGRAPYPNELGRLEPSRAAATAQGAPLLVAPLITSSVGAQLNDSGWSWADTSGNVGIHAGTWHILQRKTERTRPSRQSFPGGTGATAVIRALLSFRDGDIAGRDGVDLVNQAGVTQPRLSQVLKQLVELGLVRRGDAGWTPDRPALLDAFLASYRGPKGSELPLYTLDPLRAFTARLAAAAVSAGRRCVVSADVGPDALVGWRRPEVSVVYLDGPIDVASLDAAPAKGRHDANVLLRLPEDTSVFRPMDRLVAEIDGVEVDLAPVSQQLWDLHDLGGSERLDIAGQVRSWFLDR